MASVCLEEWALMCWMARLHEVLAEPSPVMKMVFTARIGARNSVVKSASVASCKMAACDLTRELESTALEVASQRRETPFSSSADATVGRMVESAASSTSSVSTALQAAG